MSPKFLGHYQKSYHGGKNASSLYHILRTLSIFSTVVALWNRNSMQQISLRMMVISSTSRCLPGENLSLTTISSETRPLLVTPERPTSYLQPPKTAPITNTDICVSSISDTAHGSTERNFRNPHNIFPILHFHELGWIEYHLPNGLFYYVHPTRRVTTDINLRMEKALNAVTAYLENDCEEAAPSGCELWLRDSNTARGGGRGRSFEPRSSWVNHQTKSVVTDAGYDSGKKRKSPEEDR